jgi:hypothetical protein
MIWRETTRLSTVKLSTVWLILILISDAIADRYGLHLTPMRNRLMLWNPSRQASHCQNNLWWSIRKKWKGTRSIDMIYLYFLYFMLMGTLSLDYTVYITQNLFSAHLAWPSPCQFAQSTAPSPQLSWHTYIRFSRWFRLSAWVINYECELFLRLIFTGLDRGDSLER